MVIYQWSSRSPPRRYGPCPASFCGHEFLLTPNKITCNSLKVLSVLISNLSMLLYLQSDHLWMKTQPCFKSTKNFSLTLVHLSFTQLMLSGGLSKMTFLSCLSHICYSVALRFYVWFLTKLSMQPFLLIT